MPNSAVESKKHWTIGDPRVSDVTHECKYIGRSLTNEQYTKILDRYVNLSKDHLDYIDSDKITLTGDKIKILL